MPERWLVGVKPKTESEASGLVIATDAHCEGEMIIRGVIELYDYRGSTQRL